MPQTSLQENHKSNSYNHHQETKSSQLQKRKRKSSGPCEDTENIYPPKRLANSSRDPPKTPQTTIVTSPVKEQEKEPSTWSELRQATCFLTPSTSSINSTNKSSPLPSFPWADGSKVWSVLCLGDQKTLTQRDPLMFQRHPSLQPRMRAILLDWLIEVSEVYKLHRETYYLAMDYIDRYLSTHQNVPKNQLQLLGITCLFIAAKVEEIYPPKLSEFAYVTDGACTEEEILGKELIVLKGLGWNLSPVTPPGWLNVFMQIESGDWSRPNGFIYPQYSGLQYSQSAQLLDLATLDDGSLKFPYSHMAAASIYHTLGRETALGVSRLTWEQLLPCVKWLAPFANTIFNDGTQLLLRTVPPVDSIGGSGLRAAVPNIVLDESHRIQTHVVDLEMLEKAQLRLTNSHIHSNDEFIIDNNSSIDASDNSPDKSGLLTPPSSSHKNSPTPIKSPPSLEPYT